MINDIVVGAKRDEKTETLLIAACGYEERSIHFAIDLNLRGFSKILVADYEAKGILSYERNKRGLDQEGSIEFCNSDALYARLCKIIGGTIWDVTIDISSFDRSSIASILTAIFLHRASVNSVTFVYYPQSFVEPEYKLDTVKSFGPVSPFLAGTPLSRSGRLCLVLGAGHEFGKAIGALDALEPDEVFCFKPRGVDSRYEATIMKSNMDFEFLEDKGRMIEYDLEDPFDTYMKLRSLLAVKSRSDSVIILPLGPKLFAALSILIALIYHPNIKVWRHSTVGRFDSDSVKQATATGGKISFEFSFVKTNGRSRQA